MAASTTFRCGAYGFDLLGLAADHPALFEPGADWPKLHLHRSVDPAARYDWTGDDLVVHGPAWAQFRMPNGRIIVERESWTVSIETNEPVDDEALLHPYLGSPAAVAASWLGRQAVHGAALLVDGAAWGVLGDKEAGKSSLVGQAVAQGLPVLADDVLICDATSLWAGPQIVDLRSASAAALPGATPLGVVGARERWRLRTHGAPPVAPLRGFVHLAWGTELRLDEVPAGERFAAIAAGSFPTPTPRTQLQMLELAAMPAWRFTRPRDLSALGASTAWLIERLRSS